jgi:hypothetical protein
LNKSIRALLASGIFTAVLFTVYLIHINWLKVDVVFYAAIADVLIAAFIAGAIVFYSAYFALLNPFEKIQLCLIWLLAGYALAISVPTVIDRSLSFYILEKIQQRGGAIAQDRFDDVFTKEYVIEHQLVAVRLTEQLQSGTISIINGCVRLTQKGERLARFSRFFRQNLLPKQRLLLGEYTDALTNPFKHSVEKVDYQCQ